MYGTTVLQQLLVVRDLGEPLRGGTRGSFAVGRGRTIQEFSKEPS